MCATGSITVSTHGQQCDAMWCDMIGWLVVSVVAECVIFFSEYIF